MASSAVALSSYMSVRAPNVVPGHRRDVGLGLPSLKSVRQRNVVRCQAKPEKGPSSAPKTTSEVSTKLSNALAFSGPAPERINGRLAMLGFVTALAVEAARGEDLFAQLSNGGFPWFIGTAVVFLIASLVPLFKGDDVQSKTEGIMNESAEMWNGRFAMLGLVALTFTEYFKGGPLV